MGRWYVVIRSEATLAIRIPPVVSFFPEMVSFEVIRLHGMGDLFDTGTAVLSGGNRGIWSFLLAMMSAKTRFES